MRGLADFLEIAVYFVVMIVMIASVVSIPITLILGIWGVISGLLVLKLIFTAIIAMVCALVVYNVGDFDSI